MLSFFIEKLLLWTFGHGWHHQQANTTPSSTVSVYRHTLGIAPEVGNVVVDPSKGGNLIQHPIVTGYVWIASREESYEVNV